jgi:hypothetical protein
MKEETVREVFVKYLKNLNKSPKIRKKNVPGPDVIIEGVAYECKGSDFDKNTLFKQVVSNALQFSRVGIVIPYDALSLPFAYQLGALEVLAREDPYLERSIEMYVIAEENGIYFLHRWSSARLLLLEIDRVAHEHLPQLVKLAPEEKELKILEFLKDFDDRMREYLRNIVIKEGKNPSNRWESFSCTLE